MRNKLLFVTDLDGTFIEDSVAPTVENVQTIQQIAKKGAIAVATGRSIKEIRFVEKMNGLRFDYLIGFNGAIVEDREGNILHDQPIPKQQLIKLLDFIEKNELVFDVLDGVERVGNFMHERPETLWNMKLICVENPFSLLEGRTIYKINLRCEKEKKQAVFEKITKEFPNLSIFDAGGTRIEVTDKGISKATGIHACDTQKEFTIISAGDSGNDVPMFEFSEQSYCMSGAKPEVADKATFVKNCFSEIEI
ncbi:MAG: HAD family hydrolase [Lactobacillales bacterium]|jgi:Cof subfamily protein (haloacid dehalogenase superfamily)|nr:HAD family hydrolase [Lactobacillales bacterium]